MDKPIPDARFMDDAMLRIKDMEPMIRAVAIAASRQFFLQGKDIVLQVPLELLNVHSPPLAAAELTPSGK